MTVSSSFTEEFLLNPVLKDNQTYRFKTTTIDFSNRKKGIEKSCTRDVQIKFMGKIKDIFVFDVFIEKVTFSQNTAHERLLKKDIYAYRNVLMGTDEKGEIVKIYNLNQMQNEWEETKKELRKDHTGYEFEDFLNDNTVVLANEEKTIYYLKTPAMYGLFFHGLFGKYDHTTIKRNQILLDFDSVEITEEIKINNKSSLLLITAKKSDASIANNNAINDGINQYEGIWMYKKENQLLEGNLKIESEKCNINYNVLWVGSKI
jgi:hypothetical protein